MGTRTGLDRAGHGGQSLPLSWRAAPGRFLSAGREQVGGRTCIVLRDTAAQTDSRETLWVDDERAVIVRWRSARPNKSVEIGVEYQQTPHGWLPRAWERTEMQPAHPPTVSRRVTVTSVAFSPPVTADDFRIALRPEMTVRRDGVAVRVRDVGSLEPESPGPDPMDKHVSAAVRALGWPGLVGAAVAVALVCVFVQLRRHRKSVGS